MGTQKGSYQNFDRIFLSVLICAYNESKLLNKHLEMLVRHLEAFDEKFQWELVIVNDGSTDNTGAIADLFSNDKSNVKVIHHRHNQGLGKALRTGFENTKGNYVITMDCDLSCSLDHIQLLLDKILESNAKVVVAAPNKMTGIPWHRKVLSRWANRFLALSAHSPVSNLTHMVRAYDGPFIRSLPLRSKGMEIMPEIIHKTLILKERVEEIPAHLDWSRQNEARRSSSMRILKHTGKTLLTGFLLRPFMFFIIPGLLLLVFAFYVNYWMVTHFIEAWPSVSGEHFFDHASHAIALAYTNFPHTFIIGFLSTLLAIQLIGLGLSSYQNAHYFEELFTQSVKKDRYD